MKIILNEDIKGLGKKFDVKEVKNGYAKNFLIAKKLAKAATESNLKILARQKSVWENQEKELIEHNKKIASQLESVVLDFGLKVGDNEQTFGSISASEIEKKLKDLDIFKKFFQEIKKIKISLEKPIKELGEYLVEIDLGKGISSKIKIKVRSQS